MLAGPQVPRYLLERGLLTAASVVAGDLVVRRVSRRNSDHAVIRRGAPSYFLKQGLGASGRAAVAHEAAVYEALSGASARLARHLPRVHAHDEAQALLVLELVGTGESLLDLHRRTGLLREDLAAELGLALAALHRLRARGWDGPAGWTTPWALTVHRPTLADLDDLSSAGLTAIALLQGSPALCRHLDDARARWRPRTLIHGDVKWDNLVLGSPEDGRAPLALVDWEIARPGDPCWDVGSALAQHLSCWLDSIPVTGVDPLERFPELARHPIESMWPALGALWEAYVEAMGLPAADADACLEWSVSLAGARLVQSAIEATGEAAEVTAAVVLHLQLAENVMARPHQAAAELLGLPVATATGPG